MRRCHGAQRNQLRTRRIVRQRSRGIDRRQRHRGSTGPGSIYCQELDPGQARHGGHLPGVRDHRRPPANPPLPEAARSQSARRVRELHLWGDRLFPRSVPRTSADLCQRAVRVRAIARLCDPDLLADRTRAGATGGDRAVPQRYGFATKPLGRVQASAAVLPPFL